MKYTIRHKSISILSAAIVALIAFGLTAVDAASPGGGGPGTDLCDGMGPGAGEGERLRDGSGAGEGGYRHGTDREGRRAVNAERRGAETGVPRFDGKGPRHEDGPRHGLGRTGEGRGGSGDCGRVRLRDGSGEGGGQMQGHRRGAGGAGGDPSSSNR